MGRPRKPPAFLVAVDVRKASKLAALPSDTARLGFFYVVLAEAKVQPVPGMFASRGLFRELAGRFARYLDRYLDSGVLEGPTSLCSRCIRRWGQLPRGSLIVHDWHEHQYDPGKVERQRDYEQRHRVSDGVSDAKLSGVSDAISDAVSDSDLARAGAPDRAGPRGSNIERRTSNDESGSLSSSDIFRARDVDATTTNPSEKNGRENAYAGAHGMSRAIDLVPERLRR